MLPSQWFKLVSVVAGDVRAEAGGEVSRDGSSHAFPDGAAVEFGDSHDFRGSSGEKHFVGRIEIVAVHGQFFDAISRFAAQLDHRVAGDAAKRDMASKNCP